LERVLLEGHCLKLSKVNYKRLRNCGPKSGVGGRGPQGRARVVCKSPGRPTREAPYEGRGVDRKRTCPSKGRTSIKPTTVDTGGSRFQVGGKKKGKGGRGLPLGKGKEKFSDRAAPQVKGTRNRERKGVSKKLF